MTTPIIPMAHARPVAEIEADLDKAASDAVFLSAEHLLHRLWTKAVGTSDYVKSEWKELEQALYELRRAPK